MKRTLLATLLAAAVSTAVTIPVTQAAEAAATKVSRYQAGYYHFKIATWKSRPFRTARCRCRR